MYLAIICFILITIIIILLAYIFTAAYEQTLSLTIPFEETYRYLPDVTTAKLDSIKITVAGTIKQDKMSLATIVHGNRLQDLVKECIINHYKNAILFHEADIFNIDNVCIKPEDQTENTAKRIPLSKYPSIENLSIIFFNKLGPLLPKIGCQLVSVGISSENLKVTHHRYKISNYTM